MAKFNKQDMLNIEDDCCNEFFEIVEKGEWEQDGKYQSKYFIFKFNNKFYRLHTSRSGSPFTDWNYDSEYWDDTVECSEVEKIEVVKHIWKTVK